MTLVQRLAKAPYSIESQAALSTNRRRVQLDMGFKGNLDAFKTGRIDLIRPMPIEAAIDRVNGQGIRVQLVCGLGTGSDTTGRLWFDITALGERNGGMLDTQGFTEHGRSLLPITVERKNCGNEAFFVPGPGSVYIYPIGQFMLSTNRNEMDTEDTLYLGELSARAMLTEILKEVPQWQGKFFAIIRGSLGEIQFRPLKPRGPKQGRAFTHDRQEGSDVVWIKSNGRFDGFIVVSFDASSYTSIHSHVITYDRWKNGGHIENAVIESGAGIMLVKAHEIVSVD